MSLKFMIAIAITSSLLVAAESHAQQSPVKDLEAKWGNGIFSADKWIEVVYSAVN